MTTITTRSGKGLPLTNNEVDANFVNLNDFKVEQTSSTGSALIPSGTNAQRDGSPVAGSLRYNTDLGAFEGYSTSWSPIGYTSADFDTDLASKSTSDLAEGTNLYYTDARARASISVSGDLSYDSGTGVISTQGLASSTTDDLAEGSTNLYYTDARVDARLSSGSVTNVTTDIVNLTDGTIDASTGSTSSTSQTEIASFVAATFNVAKLIVKATNGTDTYATELLVVHNGTTASATEYGQVSTNTFEVSYDVDINAGNVRLLATAPSAAAVTYNIMKTLM